MGKVNNGYWVFVNFIPTAAHTIWGVICGQLLLADKTASSKLKYFFIGGTSILVLGMVLEVFEITPIIKRIATSSFTLVSGGAAILALALFYWAIDLKKNHKKWLNFFSVVGTNAIFIYLFSETVGAQWFKDFGLIWTEGLLMPLGVSYHWILVINSLLVLGIFWFISYFLDRKKIYFKV
jgi:predicted acyltransferase